MSSQFVKDLYMMQWALNGNWEAGSDEVRRSQIRGWFDPISDSVVSALHDWEAQGFITIMADPRHCKDKEVCLKLLKTIDAVPEPSDLNDDT